jgi:hypothetical protein
VVFVAVNQVLVRPWARRFDAGLPWPVSGACRAGFGTMGVIAF